MCERCEQALTLNKANLYFKKRPQQTLQSEQIHVFYCVEQAVWNIWPVCTVGSRQVYVNPGTWTNQSGAIQHYRWTHPVLTGGKLEPIMSDFAYLSSVYYLGAHLATSLFHLSALRSSAGDSSWTLPLSFTISSVHVPSAMFLLPANPPSIHPSQRSLA